MNKFKLWFKPDYSRPLSSNGLFILGLYGPIVISIFFWFLMWLNGPEGNWDFSPDGFDRFWGYSKVPLSILSTSPILAVIIATVHRSAQQARANNQVEYFHFLEFYNNYAHNFLGEAVEKYIQGGSVTLFRTLFEVDNSYNLSPHARTISAVKEAVSELIEVMRTSDPDTGEGTVDIGIKWTDTYNVFRDHLPLKPLDTTRSPDDYKIVLKLMLLVDESIAFVTSNSEPLFRERDYSDVRQINEFVRDSDLHNEQLMAELKESEEAQEFDGLRYKDYEE